MALTDNLVAFWNFEEQRTFGDCKDAVGSNHFEQYGDPDVITGRKGSGRLLKEGKSLGVIIPRYLEAADSADLSVGGTDFTWLMWGKRNKRQRTQLYSFSLGKNSDTNPLLDEYGLRYDHTGLFRFHVSNNSAVAANEYVSATWRSDNLRIEGTPYELQIDVWYMLLGRWDESTETARLDVWQGQTTAGDDPPIMWPYKSGLGRHDSGLSSSGSPTFSGSYNGTNPLKIGKITANPASTGPTHYYGTGDVDLVGLWKRQLTDAEALVLWNGGMGIGYPFLLPGPELYAPIPGPIYLPVPHSLYTGHSWNVGETPVIPPAPESGWMTQPTLPAWRVQPRLRGWSYGNNGPIVAPVPLVTQWRLSTNEPVRDEEERKKKAIASSAPSAFPAAALFETVIPAPPLPPEPPDDNSEAITSDEPYRPGRADQDSSRYLDSDGHVQ